MECLNLDQPLEGYRDFKRGVESSHQGDFETASLRFRKAKDWAVRHHDTRLEDRAVASGWSIVIAQGEFDRPLPELRTILHRGDPENCFLAAYNIACAFESKKEYRKGQFYAQVALQHAKTVERSEWMGWVINLLGSFHMALGDIPTAMEHYRSALRYIDTSNPGWIALVQQNIGYGHLISGDPTQGFRYLYHSLRTARRLGLETSLIHLDLAWGFVDTGNSRLALKHSQKALTFAKTEGDKENTKNALLLLGQSARHLTQKSLADECYSKLESFYPGQEQWISMVKNINVNSLISLRA